MNNHQDRYHRQIILNNFGIDAQAQLQGAKVLVIGAGGLGCPILQYLTAAGVGCIGVIDDDVVSLSNLHRQILFDTNDIGKYKVDVVKLKLTALNDSVKIECHKARLNQSNAMQVISNYDFIIDGSDNFSTRYIVNDVCVLLKKCLIIGAVSQWQGQVAVFDHIEYKAQSATNYRDIFPNPPLDNEIKNCEEAGVIGVLPGMIGVMMATELVKIVTTVGSSLANKLLTYDALTYQQYIVNIKKNNQSLDRIPKNLFEFLNTNYDFSCSTEVSNFEIEAEEFCKLAKEKNVVVIDVRELHESPSFDEFAHKNIPVIRLQAQASDLKESTILLICQSGLRSAKAHKILSNIYFDSKQIYSLNGGLIALKNYLKTNQLQENL